MKNVKKFSTENHNPTLDKPVKHLGCSSCETFMLLLFSARLWHHGCLSVQFANISYHWFQKMFESHKRELKYFIFFFFFGYKYSRFNDAASKGLKLQCIIYFRGQTCPIISSPFILLPLWSIQLTPLMLTITWCEGLPTTLIWDNLIPWLHPG